MKHIMQLQTNLRPVCKCKQMKHTMQMQTNETLYEI